MNPTDGRYVSTIEKIFGLLNVNDLRNISQVSVEWKNLVESYDNFWKKMLDKKV